MSKQINEIQSIIDDETSISKQTVSVTDRKTIPPTSIIPIESHTAWIKVPDVIACFVDMEGSTKLSASSHGNTTAKAYRYFTNSAIRMFHEFGSPYIDVKGDGVFALFNPDQAHTALASVVSFKTFVADYFTPQIKKLTDLTIGGHFGIDQKTVLVRKLGLKFANNRTDRQNEVWAGKPINMAAKLASLSSANRLLVSDRYFSSLTGDRALKSCGCGGDGSSGPLWEEVDLSKDDRFDFRTGWVLKADWCVNHGAEYCRSILDYDKD
jgi:class 3 adenylate cyclase